MILRQGELSPTLPARQLADLQYIVDELQIDDLTWTNPTPTPPNCAGKTGEALKQCLCETGTCTDLLYFFHSNHIGSSTFLTDFSGQPYEYILYLPFGELLVNQKVGPYETPYKFTGKEQDPETDLTYFGARYYDAALGIWLGVDPLAEKYPAISPFTYVFNNPIKYIDPTGMEGGDPDQVDKKPTFKLLNMDFWNPKGKAHFGSVVVLPMNLDDHNGAMQQRFDEAMKLGVPIIQTYGRNGFADAMLKMKEIGVSVNTFVIAQHGNVGTYAIGNEGGLNFTSDVSMLNEGLKNKNVVFTNCNLTRNSNGYKMLRNFSMATSSTVYTSDHLGWSLNNLNGSQNGFLGVTSSLPFIRREDGDGQYFNDFHMSKNGGRVHPVFNLGVNYSTGSINYSNIDNMTSGKRTKDRQ